MKKQLGVISVVLVGYLTIIGTRTEFRPVHPDRAEANRFLQDYYRDVTGGDVAGVWSTRLTEEFRDNANAISGLTFDTYAAWWQTVDHVDVRDTKQVAGDDFVAELSYTMTNGHLSAPETTYFTLRCPNFTAWIPFGCSHENIKITDTRRA